MYKLRYRRKARNYLAGLPVKTKTVIVKKLHELCLNPDSPSLDIDTLEMRKSFRMRVGKYRVIYTRKDNGLIIEIVKIRPRGDIYRR